MSDQARNMREGREVSHALSRKLEKNVRILPKPEIFFLQSLSFLFCGWSFDQSAIWKIPGYTPTDSSRRNTLVKCYEEKGKIGKKSWSKQPAAV